MTHLTSFLRRCGRSRLIANFSRLVHEGLSFFSSAFFSLLLRLAVFGMTCMDRIFKRMRTKEIIGKGKSHLGFYSGVNQRGIYQIGQWMDIESGLTVMGRRGQRGSQIQGEQPLDR